MIHNLKQVMRKNHFIVQLAVLLLLYTASCKEIRETSSEDVRQQSPLEQFQAKKFGMFIHWGLYVVPAGEWKGKYVRGIGEWKQYREKIPIAEYEKLAEQFNPVRFNADEWSQLAEDAGMKYMVITSKHNDGFAI